jgi:hypothetical protein
MGKINTDTQSDNIAQHTKLKHNSWEHGGLGSERLPKASEVAACGPPHGCRTAGLAERPDAGLQDFTAFPMSRI